MKSSPPTRSAKRQPAAVRTSLSVNVPTSGELALIAGSSPAGELPAMSANSPLVGTFTDRLVRTPEGWRFAERVGGLDFRP